MASDTMQAPSHESQQPGAALLASPRPWPAVVLVGLYWASHLAAKLAGLSLFPRFLADLAGCGPLTLLFLGWWLDSRRRSGWEQTGNHQRSRQLSTAPFRSPVHGRDLRHRDGDLVEAIGMHSWGSRGRRFATPARAVLGSAASALRAR